MSERVGLSALAGRVLVGFARHRGPLFAAAVAFYMVVSLIPLVLLGLWAAGTLLGDSEATRAGVLRLAAGLLPGPAGRRVVEEAVAEVVARRATTGWWGLLTLAFAASGGFATVEAALNAIWGAPDRHPLWGKVRAVGGMLVTGGLLLASLGLTTAVRAAAALPHLPSWLMGAETAATLASLLALLASTVMFTLLYKTLPNCRTRWRASWIAGFTAAVVWEVAKTLYAWYAASRWGDRSATYGALAGLVGLIIWIYYSSLVLLLGAELARAMQTPPPPEGPSREAKGPAAID